MPSPGAPRVPALPILSFVSGRVLRMLRFSKGRSPPLATPLRVRVGTAGAERRMNIPAQVPCGSGTAGAHGDAPGGVCAVAGDRPDPEGGAAQPGRWRRDGGVAEPTGQQRWDTRPQSFKDSCHRFYQAEMKELDFVNAAEKPTKRINTWVANKIGEIFTQILVLPDVGKELNMIVVLPDENTNLEMVEKELSYEKFIEWTRPGKMYEDELEVFLPRFKLEESYDMEDVLCSLGMTNAFEEERADFLGMSSKKGLYLSRIIHKSFVEVSEEGTEAAAVTTIIMVPT